ncbi:Component of a complex containing the Tor2p kinase [Komagataella phaffii CBS 7435]|uniref:Component of a complex containing the Tor2p kinase and other proteins, which may have a role in regu n=2 Tax=Komagataella phaffii TaxID=460519 RepID=C4R028_KOMPG|nr:uncharacterized protein PAS_chr2-1_0241 [Komagataella phaffii GS115]AOA62520.1 GQ67_00270T0 [Komagataella phaffii]CAH2448647.1 Component of a complex containing the Tor2p kinase [Komagataella phaffii CBS 7435]AOA67314.1 GQ68_01119T0 [Komagataella phaffii GS115]CAY68852.1 Component of a complex containing the Tor2p kinase and other proteins, which may have a role in regu [Komagataella phaffii GS115]CCA38741.1 Component of a complex containing the Tor2p kinase [Komagataella phaffii CBS 7435]
MEPKERLRNAVKEGNEFLVTRILKKFPDLLDNIDPANGWSNLHYASYHGNYLIATKLLKGKEKYHEYEYSYDSEEVLVTFKNETCLHLAAMNNHEQTLHLLLQHLPNCIDNRDIDDQTPLHIAAAKGNTSCLQLLLDLHASINVQDKNGNCPLHLASIFGHLSCIQSLSFYNADMGLKNADGYTPLDVCFSFEIQKQLEHLKENAPTLPPFPSKISEESLASPSLSNFIIQRPSATKPESPQSKSTLPHLPSVTTARKFSSSSQTTLNSSATSTETKSARGERPVSRLEKQISVPSFHNGDDFKRTQSFTSLYKVGSGSYSDLGETQSKMLPIIKPINEKKQATPYLLINTGSANSLSNSSSTIQAGPRARRTVESPMTPKEKISNLMPIIKNTVNESNNNHNQISVEKLSPTSKSRRVRSNSNLSNLSLKTSHSSLRKLRSQSISNAFHKLTHTEPRHRRTPSMNSPSEHDNAKATFLFNPNISTHSFESISEGYNSDEEEEEEFTQVPADKDLVTLDNYYEDATHPETELNVPEQVEARRKLNLKIDTLYKHKNHSLEQMDERMLVSPTTTNSFSQSLRPSRVLSIPIANLSKKRRDQG